MSSIDPAQFRELIALAKREDLGDGDITTALLENRNRQTTFELVAKSRGVFSGREITAAVLAAYDDSIVAEWADHAADGMRIDAPPIRLATLRGPLASLLAVERVLLNFLQRLSGIATLTRAFVDVVEGTSAIIFDTRKTTPGWRSLEKYAVRCGGGRNHRMGLFDSILIKDNHIQGVPTEQLAGRVFDMLNGIDFASDKVKEIEVETQTVEQVEQLLKVVGINVILLDNFTVPDLRRAVILRDHMGLRGKIALEASGGVTLQTVRAVAETGVERISVGALTHSALAMDLSLDRI